MIYTQNDYDPEQHLRDLREAVDADHSDEIAGLAKAFDESEHPRDEVGRFAACESAGVSPETIASACNSPEANKVLGDIFGDPANRNTAMFGGCRVVAEALLKLHPEGELVALVESRDGVKDDDAMVHHYMVKMGDDQYLDGQGLETLSEKQGYFADNMLFGRPELWKPIPATAELVDANKQIQSPPGAAERFACFIREYGQPVGKDAEFEEKHPRDDAGKFSGDSAALQSQGKRSKPGKMVAFETPITGPSGASLVAYEWKHKIEEGEDYLGRDKTRRVSDWDASSTNPETGRDVVHQFHVRMPDGNLQVVSSETVPVLLGLSDKSSMGRVQPVLRAAQAVAQLQMQRAEAEHLKGQYEALREKVKQLPHPPITSLSDGRDGWAMGDVENQRRIHGPDTDEASQHGELVHYWEMKRLDEMVGNDAKVRQMSGAKDSIRLLDEKINLAERKLKDATAKSERERKAGPVQKRYVTPYDLQLFAEAADARGESHDVVKGSCGHVVSQLRCAAGCGKPHGETVLDKPCADCHLAGQGQSDSELLKAFAEDEKDGVWRTINGRHVQIKDGETPEQAVARDIKEQGEGGKGGTQQAAPAADLKVKSLEELKRMVSDASGIHDLLALKEKVYKMWSKEPDGDFKEKIYSVLGAIKKQEREHADGLQAADEQVATKSGGVLVYHGTIQKFLPSILKNGLIPTRTSHSDDSKSTAKRAASVYVSRNQMTSREYANDAKFQAYCDKFQAVKGKGRDKAMDSDSMPQYHALVIEAVIPKKWFDSHKSKDTNLGPESKAYMVPSVKPEWIMLVRDSATGDVVWSRDKVQKADDDTETLYSSVVIFFDDKPAPGNEDSELLKAFAEIGKDSEFESQHPRDDDGKFTQAGAGDQSGDSLAVPPPMGSTPIPAGHIRLYHYTKGDPAVIRKEGLKLSSARGHVYGEPDLVWAANRQPDPQSKVIVEFHTDAFDKEIGLDSPRKGQDLEAWQNDGGLRHVGFTRDIKPEEIIAVHEPWQDSYRKMAAEPVAVQMALEGDMDWALEDPYLAKAVIKIKQEHGLKPNETIKKSSTDFLGKDVEFEQKHPRGNAGKFVAIGESEDEKRLSAMGGTAASQSSYWAGRVTEGPPEKVWVITSKPKFKLDPNHKAQHNYTQIVDVPDMKGIYVTNDPEYWWNRYQYRRPFIAEITVNGKVPWENVPQGSHQAFINGVDFGKLKVDRVIPIDEWVHENYQEHGWVEEFHGTTNDGTPLAEREYGKRPFAKGYRYSGDDVRDMAPEQVKELMRRFARYNKVNKALSDDVDFEFKRGGVIAKDDSAELLREFNQQPEELAPAVEPPKPMAGGCQIVEQVSFKPALRRERTVLLKVRSETENHLSGLPCDERGCQTGEPEVTIRKRQITARKSVSVRQNKLTPMPLPDQLRHLSGTASDTPADSLGRFPQDPTFGAVLAPARTAAPSRRTPAATVQDADKRPEDSLQSPD